MTRATETTRNLFITGLKNAHAVENQALSIMNRQVERLTHYPELSERLHLHIGETKMQARRLEEILDGMGEQHSSLKDAALSFVGNMAAIGHTLAGDEILKNSFADLAFENFEIASYRSLLTLADAGGFESSKSILQLSLDEERSMADWLDQNIPRITIRYLELEEAGATSKR